MSSLVNVEFVIPTVPLIWMSSSHLPLLVACKFILIVCLFYQDSCLLILTIIISSELFFKPLSNSRAYAVREIHGAQLGHLVTLRGIVTRVSDVKPFLQVNTYSCDACGHEIFQEIKQRQFTPLTECPSQECKSNNSKGKLYMQTRASKFIAFQEVKLQELVSALFVCYILNMLTFIDS
jgi:DNA replicative helicase MCM subunit Mcm2 (Cdc46/Mcm family)